jgi:hypothetical protein
MPQTDLAVLARPEEILEIPGQHLREPDYEIIPLLLSLKKEPLDERSSASSPENTQFLPRWLVLVHLP